MAIDVFGEEMVTMSQAAKRLPRPRGTKSISPSTMWRWTNAGLKAEDGQIVRLETVRIGGTRCTSIEALRRFFNRLQEPDSHQSAASYGDLHQPRRTTLAQTNRARLTPDRRSEQEEARRSLDFAFFGCRRVIDESGFSKETLREIYEKLCEKFPTARHVAGKAYDSVRRAIYTQAVEILQGLPGAPKGVKAAKTWIDSLDAKTLDVRQLKGCGSHTETEWKQLIEQGVLDKIQDQSEPAS